MDPPCFDADPKTGATIKYHHSPTKQSRFIHSSNQQQNKELRVKIKRKRY
jgi:hypothetical protein